LKSTHNPRSKVLQEITSSMRPQKCMNPAAFVLVIVTHKITMREHLRLMARKMRTVKNMSQCSIKCLAHSPCPQSS
jgi:hypothetical protein